MVDNGLIGKIAFTSIYIFGGMIILIIIYKSYGRYLKKTKTKDKENEICHVKPYEQGSLINV